MSRITSAILITWEGEPSLQLVNAYRDPEYDTVLGLVSIHDPKLPKHWYGGTRVLCFDFLIGAVNWLNTEKFIAYLQSLPWELPENVQLVVSEPDRYHFKVIDIFPNSGAKQTPGANRKVE